jgi:hypothetical protein
MTDAGHTDHLKNNRVMGNKQIILWQSLSVTYRIVRNSHSCPFFWLAFARFARVRCTAINECQVLLLVATLMHSVYCSAQCLLHCTVFTAVHSVYCNAQCLLQCTVFTAVHSVYCNAQCTVFTAVHSVYCNAQCLLQCTVFAAVHSVYCNAQCLLQCTVFTAVHSVYCSFCAVPMECVVLNVSLEISNFQKEH